MAPRFVGVFPMFSLIPAFHSEHSSFLSPCDAVAVSRVDSSKLYADSTMWRRCRSLVFSYVFVDSCVSLGTFAVFVALRCCGGLEGGFLETVRKFDHVVALRVACLLQLFSWTLAFHSDLRRRWRLAMLWLRPVWIPRSSRQHRRPLPTFGDGCG